MSDGSYDTPCGPLPNPIGSGIYGLMQPPATDVYRSEPPAPWVYKPTLYTGTRTPLSPVLDEPMPAVPLPLPALLLIGGLSLIVIIKRYF